MNNSNDLGVIITSALETMKAEEGEKFDLSKVNLAELSRRTGLSRQKLRKLKKDNFVVKPHGLTGKQKTVTVLTGYTSVIDQLLKNNVTNSEVILERLREYGYTGGKTSVKNYIQGHKDLVPAPRQIVSPQGNRGRRYSSEPGESYQMDWGFVNVDTSSGSTYQAACFAMICHHCGMRYIEFFPNAKQENLFIGMIHAFEYMGIPKYVLTDNMKSVVIERDNMGNPIWQRDYEIFMKTLGFRTKLCKPRHPFTKGKVERLVRFVKENFMAGRVFSNITELNIQAIDWCNRQNDAYHKAVDCVPSEKHQAECLQIARELDRTIEVAFYLCPERRISFDGFVNYEGRRFGVPYWYTERSCRIMRKDYEITIFSSDLSRILTKHDVTWARRDSYTRDQYIKAEPEEFPTAPVKVKMFEVGQEIPRSGFEKFKFEGDDWNE